MSTPSESSGHSPPSPEAAGADSSLNEPIDSVPFPVVGIGASAGGLEALSQLLSHMPKVTGMAFLVVQHLDPKHGSQLAALLGRSTEIPVFEAADGMVVRPDHVYVIAPNSRMQLDHGRLHITPREEGRGPHLPIDYLFRSVAEDQQRRAIAVVLSGTGSDGTQGLCEVKAVGGITFAQDERTATHSGMPHSAIDSGCVDFVLSPEEMARRLAEIGRHPYLHPMLPEEGDVEPSAKESYRQILAAVRASTGVDFSLYRDTTINRRIMRRMALHSHKTPGDYARWLRNEPSEVDALYHDLLINVTSFFREPELFEVLKNTVFPDVLQRKLPNDPLRIWVPGCSTGQEAYSLAIALLEYLDSRQPRQPIQIFATDLSDQNSLDKARAGVYPEGIEGEVSPERLRRFFRKEDHVYRIDKVIRDMCVFARHNVTADPPFSHLDLISCRNVLIYLTTPLQKRVLSAFHYALGIPGWLVLGNAETVGEHTDLFELRERLHRIYLKRPNSSRQPTFFPSPDYRTGSTFISRRTGLPAQGAVDFQKEADRILLGRYAPPGVLVDEHFEVLQFRGRTSAYLEPPPGEPTTSVLKMAREGLFLELRNALNEARKLNQPVRREQVRMRVNGGARELTIEVIPIHPLDSGVCFLVLFQEAAAVEGPSVQPICAAPAPAAPVASEAENLRELTQLRQELAATREYLQSLVEQQDAANEELRSANEEILSSNEELQSTNEELETAKEELQSANEELTTVNEQLQRRNEELDQVNNDLLNLLSGTNIPVVMVGADLRIRRFTRLARTVISLLPTDIGRPIGDIKPAIMIPDLGALLTEVIEHVQPIEREVQDARGHWYMLRIHPYRTIDNRIDGAVMVLLDIDQMRRDQTKLRQRTALIELSQDAIIIRDAADEILFWNRGAAEMYGWTSEDAQGKRIDVLLGNDPAAAKERNACLDATGKWQGELDQTRRNGSRLLVQCREVLIRDDHGNRLATLAIKRDVTEHRRAMEALREADRRKDEFLATLAHELRNPLAPIRNAIEILQHRGKDESVATDLFGILNRQVRQLSTIVEQLVDVSRIAERKIQLHKERVDLDAIVKTAVESCRSLIERRRHRLAISLPKEPVHFYGDPVRLTQVLVNLLDNAAKYTYEGGQILLSAELAASRLSASSPAGPDKQDIVIHVRDNGIGIPAPQLPRIFDMFMQGEPPKGQLHGGLGIGLTLARSLVQMHGGEIAVQSDGPGCGSEFSVRLPVRNAPAKPPARAASAEAAAASRRILVVDDNADQLRSLGLLLKLMGHEVMTAESGPEALTIAAEFRPEVMLVDIGLPGLSGHDVARQIRSQPELKNIILAAQTGWGQEEDRNRSREAGFDHHLVKPVSPEALEELLRELPKSS